MPKRPITKELFQRLIESYRSAPQNHKRAAELAGCDGRTAKRAWELGFSWAREESGARRPIREIIAEEQELARARLDEERLVVAKQAAVEEAQRKAEIREKAARDATDARVQEAQLVRLARTASLQLLGTLTRVSTGAAKVGEHIARSLDELASVDPATQLPKKLTALEMSALTRLMNSLTTSLRQANEAASRAMEMERTLLGEPSKIIGHVHVDLDMNEAADRIAVAQRAIDRARAKGIIDSTEPLSLPAVSAHSHTKDVQSPSGHSSEVGS